MNSKIRILKWLAGILLLLGVVITAVKNINNNGPRHETKTEKASTATDTAAPKPVFRNDGQLQFVDAKSLKTISSIDIEVADNDASREQGLMYRQSMDASQGMLFMMEREEMQSFWMKNTIIPLDIIFVNADRQIVSIKPDCRPYSLDQILSDKPALYVVEVNGGYAEKHGLKPGDRIVF